MHAQQPPAQPAQPVPEQPVPDQPPAHSEHTPPQPAAERGRSDWGQSQPAADWHESKWQQSDWWSESGGGYTQSEWDEWKANKQEETVPWQSASNSNQETPAGNRRRPANSMWQADNPNGTWSAESWEAWKDSREERRDEWLANGCWSVKKSRLG